MRTEVGSENPTPEAVEAQAAKISASSCFRNSPRLIQILKYVIENYLSGEHDALKESLIAIEVFKKKEFDSRLDASVRRAVGRLRLLLAKYYATEGKQDPIVIEVPEGHYIPRLSVRPEIPESANLTNAAAQAVPALPDLRGEIAIKIDTRSSNWRKWKAVIACGTLAAIAAGGVALFASLHRPTPSPQHRRRSIAVIDFRSLKGQYSEAWLSTALAELFRSEIAGGGNLRTVSEGNVGRMMRELSLANPPVLPPDLLIKIRENLGVDLVLSGSYLCEGAAANRSIRIDAMILDSRTGEVVTSVIETGSLSQIFDLVSHTGTVLRARLGEPDLTLNEERYLKSFQPTSVEVERLYAEGIQKMRSLDAKGAQPIFEKALVMDPNYAMGHLALAGAWAVLGYQSKALAEARRAYEHSTNLAPEDALWIEGRYRQLSHNWERAIRVYESLSTFYPDNTDYSLALADSQMAALHAPAASKTIAAIRKLPADIATDPRIELAQAEVDSALGDFKSELAAARRADQQSRRRGARLLEAAAELKEGWSLENLGDFQGAAQMDTRARNAYASVGDRGGEAAATKALADVQSDSGKLDGALKNYQAALAVFRDMGHQGRVAMTLNNMAYVFKDKGDLDEANRLFQKADDIAHQTADKRVEAMALNGLAIILWRKGQIEEAKQKYEDSFERFLEAGDRSHAATILNNLGIALQDLGDLKEARQDFERSANEFREIDDKPSIARELGNLGELLIRQGDLKGAKEDVEAQLKIANGIQDRNDASYALLDLGKISLLRADMADAGHKIDESLSIRAGLGLTGLVAESKATQAEVLLAQREYAAAERAAREALVEFERENERDEEAATWAIITKSMVREGKLRESLKSAEIAIRLGANSQDREVRYNVYIAAAHAHAANGDADQAREEIQGILREAVRLGYVAIALDAQLALAEINAHSKAAGTEAELEKLEQQAKEQGFQLVANKAAALQLITSSEKPVLKDSTPGVSLRQRPQPAVVRSALLVKHHRTFEPAKQVHSMSQQR